MERLLAPLENGGLAEWLMRWFRKPVGEILCRFESCTLRQKGFCKCELSASLRSAANLYWIFGEKEMDLSIRAKEIFS